jgi:sulfur-oxidizing protein SoxY
MQTRRQALNTSAVVAGLLASTGLFPRFAFAFSKDAFEARSIHDALKAIGAIGVPGAGVLTESSGISLSCPDMADNGAVVPFAVSTTLPGVRQLLILVEKNPVALVAVFNVSENIEPAFSMRIKLAQSSDVYAVAILADGKAMYAKKDVRVTLGGCN